MTVPSVVATASVSGIATLIVAVATLVSAVGATVLGVLNRRRLGDVREAVNGQAERSEARNNQLEQSLQTAGVKIPPVAAPEAQASQ